MNVCLIIEGNGVKLTSRKLIVITIIRENLIKRSFIWRLRFLGVHILNRESHNTMFLRKTGKIIPVFHCAD